MSFGSPYLDDDFLTGGVMSRRCVAWVIDVFLIAMLVWVLWWILVMFGLLTFGLGFGAMSILPFVPFCYHFFSLLGAASATPGQQMMGLTVRRNDDLGPPTALAGPALGAGVLSDAWPPPACCCWWRFSPSAIAPCTTS